MKRSGFIKSFVGLLGLASSTKGLASLATPTEVLEPGQIGLLDADFGYGPIVWRWTNKEGYHCFSTVAREDQYEEGRWIEIKVDALAYDPDNKVITVD